MVRCLLIIFVVTVAGVAQQPAPCSAVDLRTALNESKLLAQQVRDEVTRRSQVEATSRNQQNEAQKTAAELKRKNAEIAAMLEDRDKEIISLTAERDLALFKIKKANGRWLCEILHDGCIR